MKRFVHFSNAITKEEALSNIWDELQDLMEEGNWGEDVEINVEMEKTDE